MATRRKRIENAPLPSPFPEGWYFIASRADLVKSGLIQRTWMGENIVAWCDANGRVCVAEAYCPHLGADLGPEAGGRICDGRLVCPFHGYEFDAGGQCVATPYADPPKTAKLRVFETQEVIGLVFAWWGIEGRAPQWSLPPYPREEPGWTDFQIRTLRFAGHPQETTENSVDLGHLRYVHGYDNVDRVERLSIDGACLKSDFDFKRVRTIANIAKLTFDITAKTRIVGLGYSYVKIREHSIGMDLRFWVLSTPVDGTLIDLSLVSQMREIRGPKRWIAGLGFLPVKLRAPLMNRFIAAMQNRDVLQDVVIWERKQHRSLPRLCRSDGEIMPFRTYCKQFYPDQREAATPLPEQAAESLQ